MNGNHFKSLCIAAVITLLMVAVAGCANQANTSPDATPAPTNRTITDMSGRSLVIPANITSVLGTTMPVAVPIYMLAPDKLAGWNSVDSAPKKYVPETCLKLPVVGVLGGNGNPVGNPETYLKMNPGIVIHGYTATGDYMSKITALQDQLKPLPLVAVLDIQNASNFSGEIRYLGNLLDNSATADKLVTYYSNVYQTVTTGVAGIPADQRKRVYYAEGKMGLQTDPSGSPHSQLIDLCGGINVATIPVAGGSGMSAVSMEQVLTWNPDIIIATDQTFYSGIYTNATWKDVNAVKNKQVYLVPSQPFNWFDRPNGINTVIGIPWTAKVLYPDRFQSLDLKSLTKEFYADFYHYNLTDTEVGKILADSGLSSQ